jgi:hypothetical protein
MHIILNFRNPVRGGLTIAQGQQLAAPEPPAKAGRMSATLVTKQKKYIPSPRSPPKPRAEEDVAEEGGKGRAGHPSH